jgi:hypothetical protein
MKLCLVKTSVVVGIVGMALGMSAYTVRGDEPGQANPGKPKKTELRAARVQTPLDLSGKTPVVEVKINGTGPFRFAIDTGAAHSALDDDVAKKLALKSTETMDMPDTQGGEPRAVPVVRLSSLTLGQAAFFDIQAMVVDYDKEAQGERRFDGTLGLPFFSDCLFTLDYPTERVTMSQGELPPADGREVLDYIEQGGLATIPLSFGETAMNATVASGEMGGFGLAASLVGKIEMARKALSLRRPRSAVPEGEPQEKQIQGTIRLGRHKLLQPPVHFLAGDSQRAPYAGQRILQHFALTFDQVNHRVRFARASNSEVRFGPRQPKFGFVLSYHGNRLQVLDVVPGSSAHQSPVKKGDIIRWVDSRKVSDFEADELAAWIEKVDVITVSLERGRLTLHVTLPAWE